MDRRLFVGFPVVVDSSLESALKRTKINSQKREMEVDWVAQANHHVTLYFLGAIEESRLLKTAEIVARVASETPPISTSVRGLGAFPDDHHMRVLWAGVRKSRALSALHARLAEGFSDAGFQCDERDFNPHLTLGRLRKARSGKDLLSPYVRTSFGEVSVSEIVLFESLHTGARARYEAVARFKLTGSRAILEDEEHLVHAFA